MIRKMVRVTLTLVIFSTAFRFIESQNGSNSTNTIDNVYNETVEISAIRKCFTNCLRPKKDDISLYSPEKYLRIMCKRNRTGKVEDGCRKKLRRLNSGANAANFMRLCLSAGPESSTYDRYVDRGEKLHKARKFMREESLPEIPLPNSPEEASSEELPSNQNPPKEIEESVQDLTEEELDTSRNRVPKKNDYSTFADGLCYTRYILKSNREISTDANFSIPCVQTLFLKIEKILIDEMVKLKEVLDTSVIGPGIRMGKDDETEIFHPEASIFEAVCRLTGVKTVEQFTELGRKWLINYKTAYQIIEMYRDEEEVEKIEVDLTAVTNSYIECLQKNCATPTHSPKTKKFPFYDWMASSTDHGSHYHDANGKSITANDSNMMHDSKYYDADDNSKMLIDSDTRDTGGQQA